MVIHPGWSPAFDGKIRTKDHRFSWDLRFSSKLKSQTHLILIKLLSRYIFFPARHSYHFCSMGHFPNTHRCFFPPFWWWFPLFRCHRSGLPVGGSCQCRRGGSGTRGAGTGSESLHSNDALKTGACHSVLIDFCCICNLQFVCWFIWNYAVYLLI